MNVNDLIQDVNIIWEIPDYEVWIREYGEYGSYVELPITRATIDHDNKKVILED